MRLLAACLTLGLAAPASAQPAKLPVIDHSDLALAPARFVDQAQILARQQQRDGGGVGGGGTGREEAGHGQAGSRSNLPASSPQAVQPGRLRREKMSARRSACGIIRSAMA